MNRKLASIQVVNAVEPITNADAIEKIRVLGWWIVVKKGEHAVGDKIVYCEVDSFLPERPEFEFLRSNSFKPARDGFPAGFRIKTIKLRGQVSQGICFPLSILSPEASADEDADVTDALGILKWELPAPVQFQGSGDKPYRPFPDFIFKTDEVRVQSLKTVLDRHRGKMFYVTEKLDGTSFTAFIRGDRYGICSRNCSIDETDDTIYNQISNQFNLKEKLIEAQSDFGCDLAIQGEIVGPGIQGNKYALKQQKLFVFNVLDILKLEFFSLAVSIRLTNALGLDFVPVVDSFSLDHSVDDLVEYSQNQSILNLKIQREGIVMRPLTEEWDEEIGGRLSFKVINPKFLLKYDE